MKTTNFSSALLIFLAMILSACNSIFPALLPAPTPTPLPPPEYLEGALQWLQTNAAMGNNVDWASVRDKAKNLTPNLKITSDTYPLLCEALRGLKDGNAWLQASPSVNDYSGYVTLYPDNQVIIHVDPGSPADLAKVQVGDVIESVNGAPPKPYSGSLGTTCDVESNDFTPQEQLVLRRPGQENPIRVTIENNPQPADADPSSQLVTRHLENGAKGIGYIELPMETGSHASFAGSVQQQIKKLDASPTCGWIVDLRRILGGDIWSYLAAVGPILGEGDLGGFVYPDGRREPWIYSKGQVLWNGVKRDESNIDGPVYGVKQGMPPVALLTSADTTAAGELVVVAFQGRPDVRTFGETTRGLPTLIAHTTLSDGANIFVSGAFSFDRKGSTYEGAIPPDFQVTIDWRQFGSDQDPVILAAQDWLRNQSACKP